jgi:hypothetical protein
MERNTIRGMPTPAARRRRRARFHLSDTDMRVTDGELWDLVGREAPADERPWCDRPPETEEAAAELDDAEPATC